LLQYAAARFDSLLHNATERYASLLHHAAGSKTSILKAPRIETKFEKNLGYESASMVGTFDEKTEVENLALLSLLALLSRKKML
jgi:hypothetical protein